VREAEDSIRQAESDIVRARSIIYRNESVKIPQRGGAMMGLYPW